MLGGDSALLTEGEPVESHELFNKLISKKTITGEDGQEESELKYLIFIKEIRNSDPDLFEKIKRLPKKARTAKNHIELKNSLLTYFRRGKIQKFYISNMLSESLELDFLLAAKILESDLEESKTNIDDNFYTLLDKNKLEFINSTIDEPIEPIKKKGKDTSRDLLKVLKITLKNSQKFTDEQEEYIKKLIIRLEEGSIPKQTIKEVLHSLEKINKELPNPLKVLAVIQTSIPVKLLEGHYIESSSQGLNKREVILSMYFK